MSARIILAALLAAAAAAAVPVHADVITLQDGRTYEGTLQRKGSVLEIQQTGGATIVVKADDIRSVTLKSNQSPAERANEALAYVQKQADRSSSLEHIVSLYQHFVSDHAGTPAADAAQKKLDEYQRMAGADYVKVSGKWLSPAEAKPLLAKAKDTAQQAYDAYKAGQLGTALEDVKQALAIQSDNALAYLTEGLVQYQKNDLRAAQQSFETLTQIDAQSGPGWNNLAVVLYQENRQPDALQAYMKALGAAPEARMILDNLTQALHSYTGPATARLYQDVKRLYGQHETKVEALMAQKGLYRVGNTWATQDQRSELDTKLATVKSRVDDLQKQYTDAASTLNATNAELVNLAAQYDQAVNDYNASWILWSVNGSTYWDPNWYDRRVAAVTTLNQVLQRRTQLLEVQQRAQKQAQDAKQQLAGINGSYDVMQGQPYTGVQLLMGPGDADNPPPPPPITIPSGAVAASQPAAPVVVNVNGQPGVTPVTPYPVVPPSYPVWSPGIPFINPPAPPHHDHDHDHDRPPHHDEPPPATQPRKRPVIQPIQPGLEQPAKAPAVEPEQAG